MSSPVFGAVSLCSQGSYSFPEKKLTHYPNLHHLSRNFRKKIVLLQNSISLIKCKTKTCEKTSFSFSTVFSHSKSLKGEMIWRNFWKIWKTILCFTLKVLIFGLTFDKRRHLLVFQLLHYYTIHNFHVTGKYSKSYVFFIFFFHQINCGERRE